MEREDLAVRERSALDVMLAMGYTSLRAIGAPVSDDDELIRLIERIRDLMVAVSTRGPRIQSVNAKFREAYGTADLELQKRGISNPIPFSDLWEWHGRWSSGELPSAVASGLPLGDLYTSDCSNTGVRCGSGAAAREAYRVDQS